VNKGVNRNNLTAKGYGETNPVASNYTSEGKAANRRVEIKVLHE
jgi:outer membrane protein OmpA-like peptidoglycan-associated protein